MDPPAVGVLKAVLLMASLPLATAAPCPRPCSCPQPAELHCTFRSLVAMPTSVPKHVERMNLGFNSIAKITDKSLAGLRKLELFMVHGNEIESLPDGAFRDLASLQMLKMSYNKLTEINRHSLQGLWSLARLHLDHNRLEFIHPDAFQGLTSLRLLQLEGNRLRQLHPAAFATFTLLGRFHVSTLKHLYLSDNRLTALPSGLVAAMPQLESLFLHGNPWTCDCNMRWFQDWSQTSQGVLKCKKDRALPGGQLCPACSSPKHLQGKELNGVESLACRRPLIGGPRRETPPEDTESEVLSGEDFKEPFGNVSLGLSDEHGNEVDLECSVWEPKEAAKISWEQVDPRHLTANVSLSVDLECLVDREKYEQLWRLVAYYSNVPAHLERGIILSKDPHLTYVFRQDSEKDALYYTGVRVNMMAQPEWLMQPSVDLQLNRLQSSAKMVKLTLSMRFPETVEAELARRQRRPWVVIASTNTTRKVSILGRPTRLSCDVSSSSRPVIQWILPDGSKLEAPSGHPDNRVSVSSDGGLLIKAAGHTDAGIYYCVSRVHGDFAVLPFHLTVQEVSSPPPGENTSTTPIEGFVGSPVSLPCVSSGSPDADITWILPNSKIVGFQANSSRNVVYPNGTLHIPQLQPLDGGYYKCIAMNQHGVDTIATKLSVLRHKGLARPLRKFPAQPQSASGVNTQIQVPSAEAEEEASGDSDREETSNDLEGPPRRRTPGGVAPGRRVVHASRSMRRRPPPLLRRPQNPIENRRRINMSKSKIDPEKWADILAKIRDKNTGSTATPLPERKVTEQATETPSDGVTMQEPRKSNEYSSQSQDVYATSNSYTTHNMFDMTSSNQQTHDIHTTTQPHTTQTAYNMQYTNLDPHAGSDSVFFLPQATSVSSQAVSVWQGRANIADSGSTLSLQERPSTNTDVGQVETADRAKADEGSENGDESDVTGNRDLNKLAASKERNENDPGESAKSKEGKLREASPTATLAKNAASEEPSLSRFRQSNSRRRNGGRRRGQSRRKHKPSTTPAANGPSGTSQPSTQIEILEVTTDALSNTVPFITYRVSHQENAVPQHDHKATTKPSSHDASPETEDRQAKPRSESTSAAPSFPTTSPGVGQGNANSQAAPEIPHGADPPQRSATERRFVSTLVPSVEPSAEMQKTSVGDDPGLRPDPESTFAAPSFPTTSPGVGQGNVNSRAAPEIPHRADPPQRSATEQRFISTLVPSVEPSAEMQKTSVGDDPGLRPDPGSTSGGHVETDVERVQLNHQYTPTEGNFTLLPPTFASAASSKKDRIDESNQLLTTPSTEFKDYSTPTAPETSYYNQNQTESTESVVDWSTRDNVDARIEITLTTRPPSTTSFIPNPVIPPRVMHNATWPQTSDPDAKLYPSTVEVNQNQDLQTESTEPKRTSDYNSVTRSPKPANTVHGQTPSPTATHPVRQGLSTGTPLTSSRDVSGRHQLPGRGSVPRGKPRIMKNNFQTFTVKAETDAQLPCEAEGEPMPFLSWIKVSSGASIAQNTRVQRFEVHPNGTLIIRSAQLTDGGQYLCTVQNQYGTDKMVVNLAILSQHPRVLQPRHRDVTVRLGGTVDLECEAEGHPAPRITWVLPNHVHVPAAPAGVPSQRRVSAMTNGTLRVSQAGYADRGVYKCIGSSAAGADSVSVRLHVSVSPPVIQHTQDENTTLPEGSSAYIHCTAGTHGSFVRWITPDGTQLAASQLATGRKLFVFPNGTLYIREVGPGNAGRYDCLASNAATNSRRTVNLSIRKNSFSAKASITSSSPQKTDVIYGTRVVLDCLAKGEPEPRIIWRTPSKKLVDVQYSFDPRIKVLSNGSLTIHPVTDKDSGDYLCVARNRMGDDYVLLKVNVLTRAAKIEQKLQRSSQEVVYGGDLKVDCVASGLPNPEISWALPDGTMVNLDKQKNVISAGRSRRYVVFDNGTLYLNEVGMPEEGDYTCYAENQLGKDEMKVRVKIKVGSFPPQIREKGPKSVSVFYGETITLSCNAQGEPVPVITWISPTNRVIAPALDKYQVLDDGTLVVQKVQRFDAGNYTCLARNNAGHDHKVVGLEVLVTPPVINGLRGSSTAIKVNAVQDQQKLVDCVAKGTPTPRIMWVLPGNVILPAPYYSNRMSVHLNGTLEIRSPKKTDSGQLACIARNEGGEVRMVVDFNVKEAVIKPRITSPRVDGQSLTVGNSMTLNCSLEGMTLSHITWILPNGTPLLSGARYSKFFHRPDGSLVISNPSIAEVGMYQCLGRHSGGLVERTITLSPGRKPEINNRYDSPISVMNGENLLLHCQTTGEPLRLAWTLPSGVVLNRPQRAGRYTILPNGTLAIQQISVYDRGPYVCRAANEYGSSLLSVSVIVIAYPPRITSGPPSVTYAKRGVAVQINCVATGIPKVEVAWETPDKMRLPVSTQPRLFGNKYLHPQGSLVIQNPTQRDAGVYRCTARNAIGVDSKATFLNVF